MKDKFRFIMSGMWAFLQPFVIILLSQSGPFLVAVAKDAVAAAAVPEGISGPERRDLAFRIISEAITREGIKVSVAVINACLEAAVVRLKALER